ncbi:MAG: SDR family NAD(P)-dependent oxidoreductase [Desulfobacterales bacterium]
MKTENRTGTNCPPVAIIGMGCFFPRASGLKAYWRLLFRGQDAIGEVPETHWSPADYYDKDPKKPDHVYCTRGGYLSPVSFDPSEFGIPPSALEATDTSQLLGLLGARIALEDAGYGQEREFDRDRTGVIVGATGTQELVIPLGARLGHPHWRRALAKAGISPEKAEEVIGHISDAYVPWQENSFPGLLGNVIAGRIANRLNLGGTNCAVDAACASSMAAMHMALMEIWSGRADMMVSGGVDCLNDIFMHMCFSKTPILSPTGDVRPFSANADGTLLGEGVGLLVFKALDKAEADRDRIYAVIKGIGSSSDGKSGSIYAPRAEGQIKALRTAYAQAGFSPETVDLVEAHGTGTRVGDEVEFRALKQIYMDAELNPGFREPGKRCAVGTVKSMIGHTKAAAGAAGLIKTVLALHHKVLPPTLKIDQPDPRLRISDSPFYLNTQTMPWMASPDHPRRGAVSSFGFGGSNFHMVLEEYQKQKSAPSWDGSVEILALSGASPAELETRLTELKTDMAQGMSDEEISRRAAETRAEFSESRPYRILMILEKALDQFENLTETFSAALEQIKSGAGEKARNIRNIFYGGPEHPGRLAFVFPGQGSQYTGMGRDLVSCFPQALETAEKADAKTPLPDRLSAYVYPPAPMNPEEKTGQEARLRSTDAAQPAIGAVSLSMLKILKYFGINPDAACGHSFGELCALYAGGRVDEETLMELAAVRGRLMAEAGKTNAGTMMAVQAPLGEIEKIIREQCPEVILANRNSPEQGVVSGSIGAIDHAEKVFAKHGIAVKRLPVSAAFHSPLMKDAQKAFAAAVNRIRMKSSGMPVFSNASARPYPDDEEAAKTVLAGQILSPVDFVNEIRNMFQLGVRTFVEVGPKSVLTGLIRAVLKGLHFHALSMDASGGRSFGIADLARVLCYLAALGYPVNLKNWEQPVPETRKQRMRVPISGANYRAQLKNKADEKKIAPAGGMGNAQHIQTAAPHPDGKSSAAVNTSVSGKAEIPSGSLMSADHMGKQQALPDKKQPVREIPPGSDNHTKMVKERKPMNKSNPPSASGQARHSLMSDAFRAVQEGLKSIQNLHFQTAETHKKFLEAQTRAGHTLQEMMENTRRLAEMSLGIPMPAFAESCAAPAFSSPRISGQERICRPQLQAEKTANLPHSSFSRTDTQAKASAEAASTRQAPAPISSRTAKSQSAVSEKPDIPMPKPGPKKNGLEKIEKTMLEVVSDLTGYPAEMLNLDMDIEADLGIDSIKRVEILSAFEEKMPDLPPVSPEIMGTLKTLGQIVAYLNQSGTVADAQTLPKTETPPALASAADLKKKIIALRPAPALCEPVRIPGDRPVYITQDKKGLAKAIADALRLQGAGAVLISPSQLPGKAEPPLPGGLIILADAWETQDSDFLKQVFALTRGFARDLLESAKQGGAVFATVSRLDGGFGFTGNDFENPYQGGLAGLSKTASIEWEKVCCHALDIAPEWTDAAEIAKAVVNEILHHGPVEVGLNPNGRFTPELVEAAYPLGKIALHPKDAVLVTGGARGVTAAAALALAREAKPVLILMGRSPLPLNEPEWLKGLQKETDMKKAILENSFAGKNPRPAELEAAFRKYRADREIRSNLEQMRACGATVVYFSADVRSANAVRAVIEQVRMTYGPVRALIHGAGILEDRLIADKTQEQFDRVFDTKVKGLEAVLDALKDDPLKYLILFSSVAGRMGNQGQADYATANEVLNKTAWCEARKRPECRVISFNWGPWDGGMVSSGLKKEFAKRNIALIPLETGVKAMLAEMAGSENAAVEVVIGGMLSGDTASVSAGAVSSVADTGSTQAPAATSQALSGLKREIDLTRFPFLKDHMLDGRPVVPFAMMAEWLGHSALHENPGLFFHGLEDFRLLKGISLNNGAPVPIRLISGKAKRNGALYSADVEIRTGENGDKSLIHSKARAVLGDSPPSRSPAYSSRLDIQMKTYTRSMEEVYGKILFHGPQLRGIQEIINCSPGGITAELCSAPHPEKWMAEPLRSQWLSDPLVLDCAFQMAIVWCYEEKGLFCLPVYAGSYRQYRPCFPADGLTAVLEVTETGQHRMKGDFAFLDKNKEMVARIQGYEAVMEKSLERAFFARQ